MGSLFFLFLWISPQKQKIPNFLLNQDMRIRGGRPRFSIRPLLVGRVTVVKLLLILMKECEHTPLNPVMRCGKQKRVQSRESKTIE